MLNVPLNVLQENVKATPEKYSRVCLMIDAMAIKKHITYDAASKESIGFVNLGCGTTENADVASEALVLMVVGLMGHWKAPISYFFTRTLTQDVQKSLVEAALVALEEIGITVVAMTMDGHATNLGMARLFGCDLRRPDSLRTWFQHPSASSEQRVYVLIDACHVLKIARNMLEAYYTLLSPHGAIQWCHLVKLHQTQQRDGLHLANKLSARHVEFKKQIMKVSIAAQTFSSSVAKAMQFLKEDECEAFSDASGTIEFIQVSLYAQCILRIFCCNSSEFFQIIDHLFDIMNSRSPIAKGSKAPLRKGNWSSTKDFLIAAKKFLLTLKRTDGTPLSQTRRSVTLMGLVKRSVIHLFQPCSFIY